MLTTTKLTVKNGRHAGASLVLKQQTYVAGSGKDTDIILFEDKLLPHHCKFDVSEKKVTITAIEGAVDIPGQGTIEPGYSAKIASTTDIVLGETEVTLQLEHDSTLIPGGKILSVALGCICAAMLTLELVQSDQSIASQVVDEQPKTLAQLSAPEETAAPVEASMATEVSRHLADNSLDNITLDFQENSIQLSGSIDEDKRPEFQTFQTWFDTNYPGHVLRASNVIVRPSPEQSPQAPVIQSVWHMGRSYLVSGNVRYYRDDMLPNGWRVDSINLRSVDFTYREREFRVQLVPEPVHDLLALK